MASRGPRSACRPTTGQPTATSYDRATNSDVPILQYLAGIDHPRAIEGFDADFDAMERADTCVLVLPSGRSAHLELGWFVGQGKRTAILLDGPNVTPELMYRMVDFVAPSLSDLLGWFGVQPELAYKGWRNPKTPHPNLAAAVTLLRGMNDVGAKLKVTGDGNSLVVDCEAAMESPNDVRYWYLTPEPDGTWSHAPSATNGPLYDVLRGIAASYTFDGETGRARAAIAGARR
jgi:hypothetical protein